MTATDAGFATVYLSGLPSIPFIAYATPCRSSAMTPRMLFRDHLNPGYLRYYFAAKLGSGVDDIDLNLEDFAARDHGPGRPRQPVHRP